MKEPISRDGPRRGERRRGGASLRAAASCGAGLLALCGTLAACAPTVDHRGYVPDQKTVDAIKIGEDTKQTIAGRLGTPSASGTFDGDVWYYISSREERFAFFAPEVTEREIVAVQFDTENKVASINRYSVADGHVVDYVSRKTPTRGRELTFLEQMFGNIGKLPAPGAEKE
ncbi:MAG: outer membrane protein assembly factor BamE [Alphaproteobacteria bacterium]|nr:outer membrane protein assembly factor BamE [Alphaproteobacteria bacterium]